MPSVLTAKQLAFDAAVKARSNALYLGIADLEELRQQGELSSPLVDQLIDIRTVFNGALAVEGQHIVGDAPHEPFYFDYISSPVSNGLAFADANHSFVGITLPLVFDASRITETLAYSDAVVALLGLPPDTDRDTLQGLLCWMVLGFVISHEYAHHTHGHWIRIDDSRTVRGALRRQARELDADGWAAYLNLNQWVLAGGRPVAIELLKLQAVPSGTQDACALACFVAAQAAFTFLHAPEPVDKDRVYWHTHPPQPVRLQVMSRYLVKFIDEFRPEARATITGQWYRSLMNEISRLMLGDKPHAATWREHHQFMQTPDGVVYRNALLGELDAFREILQQWEAEAKAKAAIQSKPPGGDPKPSELPMKPLLEHDEYLKQRESLVAAYTSSIKEYDRLVTWASAGALGLSISFLEKFGTNADRSTAWMLATGWTFLSLSFALSLWSQYTSSRLHSWRRQELDHCQVSLDARPDTWTAEAARLDNIGRRYGKATRWMTFLSGITLVGGIVTIATFAFLNAPFRDAGSGSSNKQAIVPEKRGQDYTPAPVPRPSSTTTPATQAPTAPPPSTTDKP